RVPKGRHGQARLQRLDREPRRAGPQTTRWSNMSSRPQADQAEPRGDVEQARHPAGPASFSGPDVTKQSIEGGLVACLGRLLARRGLSLPRPAEPNPEGPSGRPETCPSNTTKPDRPPT